MSSTDMSRLLIPREAVLGTPLGQAALMGAAVTLELAKQRIAGRFPERAVAAPFNFSLLSATRRHCPARFGGLGFFLR